MGRRRLPARLGSRTLALSAAIFQLIARGTGQSLFPSLGVSCEEAHDHVAIATLAVASPLFAQDGNMSFFIQCGTWRWSQPRRLNGGRPTLPGSRLCQGFGDLTWRAYLSTVARGGEAAVNARDRIGDGPGTIMPVI